MSTASTYSCIACEQQIQTVGGRLHVEDRVGIAPVPICEPCCARSAHDIAFRQRVETRFQTKVRLYELQQLCQRLGAPQEAFHFMATVAGLL